MMNRARSTLALTALSLAACSGLGTVPAGLIELYDAADTDGVIEIELARDGTVLEMEADIPVADLPAVVREAALARTGGGQVTGAERELRSSGESWEVKLQVGGVAWEVVADGEGNVLETERELTRDEAPAGVIAAAAALVPGGAFQSVEVIETGAESCYHVKHAVGNARYKTVVAPDGTVLRHVREARAEIEVPLR